MAVCATYCRLRRTYTEKVETGAVYCAADLADSVPIPSSIDATIPESPPDELHVVSYNVFLRPLPVSQPDYAAERAQQIGD
jgi:hypothetical protein